ncbi:MAG: DUF3078 domain-containing protein [Chitinophagaceae bacterium]
MRKQIFIFIFFSFYGFIVFAQDDIPVKTLPTEIFRTVRKDADTTKWNWKRGGLFNLNLAQGSLKNWAAGGDNFSLSLNTYVNYFLFYKHGKNNWDNNLDFNFGYVETSSLGSRKNDDRFDLLSKYGYQIDTSNKLFASVLFDFRTQLFDGYTFFTTDSSLFTSTFLSPAYILLSVGLDYKPLKYLSVFLSPITSRWTIVASNRLYNKNLYGVPAYKHSVNQIGAFASVNFWKTIFKNVDYRARIDLFSDYENNPENVDMFFTNLFSFKINKFLSATYSLDMIYDDDVKLFGKNHDSPALQLKSLIGIGVMVPLSQIKH